MNIPRDQIMLISSEKAKHIDDVQSLAATYAALLRTKIARGFKVKLAWYIFWFMVINHTRISLKNYILSNGRLTMKEMSTEGGFSIDRSRTFLVPDVTRYLLPLSMNGCGVDMDSFLLSTTESEMFGWIDRFPNDEELYYTFCTSKLYSWYKVEADSNYVDSVFSNADVEYSDRLLNSATKAVRSRVDCSTLWVDFKRELVSRAVMMEGRLLGKDIRGAEKAIISMLSRLSQERTNNKKLRRRKVRKSGNSTYDYSLIKNSGFVNLMELHVNLKEIETCTMHVCDPYLDVEPLALRRFYGYGKNEAKSGNQLLKLSRIIASDSVMCNLVTAERVLAFVGGLGLDLFNQMQEVLMLLIGYGFSTETALRVLEETQKLANLGFSI